MNNSVYIKSTQIYIYYAIVLIVFQILWRKIDSQLPVTKWTMKNIKFLEDKH